METAIKLEFNKIIEEVKKYSLFNSTKNSFDNITFKNDLDEINESLNEAMELRGFFVSYREIPFGDITDIMDIINKLTRLQSITILDGLRLIKFIKATKQINSYFLDLEPFYLKKYLEFKDLDIILNYLERIISPYELIYDNASESLFKIRSQIKTLNNKMRDVMNQLINKYQRYLQENLIVSKNNTLCLSVKEEYKNLVKGVIVDESNTGSTFYIEPEEILSIKAMLNKVYNDEANEIEKILYDLTIRLSKNTLEFEYNLLNIRALDYLSSIAKYSIEIDAYKPKINKEMKMELIKARHPLIDKNKVVPLNLNVTNNCIIITGPNTGGKTVVLKTIGLMSLMVKAGLLIPASEESNINIYDDIFIDIGDEQSIEQNLSTFSSHMKNIIEITNNIKDNSLVLLDELGGGTDPDEGVALAISILNYIRKFNVSIITTTHYSRLKLYAYETSALNAKMEFNENTLSPTYKLLVGTPGKSCGILISSHLGLNNEIIEDAKNNLNIENDFKVLNEKTDELDKEIRKFEEEKNKYDELKKSYDEKLKKLNDEKNDIIKNAKKTANKIISETKEKVDSLIKELDEARKNADTPLVAKLKNQAKNLNELDDFVRSNEKIVEDSRVYIIPYKCEGVVKSIKGNKYLVQFGSISMNFKEEDLSYLGKNTKPQKEKQKSMMTKNINKTAKLELDLRGMRYEEAYNELDKFIDDAMLMNYKSISIIHGFGTGVIRKMVWEYLKKSPYVKSFRFGGENEGLQGATIVELK